MSLAPSALGQSLQQALRQAALQSIDPAARCEPILTAYHGWSFDSSRVPASILDEQKCRMTMKSSHWIGGELNRAFFGMVDDQQYEFFRAGCADMADNAYQDLLAACMGL